MENEPETCSLTISRPLRPAARGARSRSSWKKEGKSYFLVLLSKQWTFFHYLEEHFERRLDPSPFGSEIIEAQVRNGAELVHSENTAVRHEPVTPAIYLAASARTDPFGRMQIRKGGRVEALPGSTPSSHETPSRRLSKMERASMRKEDVNTLSRVPR